MEAGIKPDLPAEAGVSVSVCSGGFSPQPAAAGRLCSWCCSGSKKESRGSGEGGEGKEGAGSPPDASHPWISSAPTWQIP